MPKILAKLKNFLIDLLFPIECLGCQTEGVWLCPNCARELKCGSPEKLELPALDNIFIAGDYEDPLLAGLIKKFKYNFITALGQPLADFLSFYWSGQLGLACLKPEISFPADLIVMPIPLSQKRLRWRGFNQAEILARELAANFSYELSLELTRTKHGRPQATLNGSERTDNIKGAFAYTGPQLDSRSVIIIDDVATTGATLNEAALVLKAQGADKVYGLVLAKG